MPNYLAPGVYVEERSSGNKPIAAAGTSVAAFIGVAQKGPINRPTLVTDFSEFQKIFGGAIRIIPNVQEHYLNYAARHFFEQGGGKCYVVRIVHYTDINNPASIQALSAEVPFAGTALDGAAVNPALTVAAINPGLWGEQLEARVSNTSRFSARLAADEPGGASVDRITLVENSDVRIGSLLWIVEEIACRVESTAANTVTVTPFRNGTIADATPVFGPDFEYLSTATVGAPVNVVADTAVDIILQSIIKTDGSLLVSGDTLTFAVTETLVTIDNITAAPPGPGGPATVAHFSTPVLNMAAFAAATTTIYARDFMLEIQQGGELLETHEHLSLVDSDLADHVDVRLGPESGSSFFIVVNSSPGIVIDNSPFTALQNGNDGLADLSDTDLIGSGSTKTGLRALDSVKDASMLCVPNAGQSVTTAAIAYCDGRADLFYLIDHPSSTQEDIRAYRAHFSSQYAAIYYPWIKVENAATGALVSVPPCGAVAGIFAKTDVKRGVHKAPAGFDTGKVTVAKALDDVVSKNRYDILYQQSINAIRKLPSGFHVWGTRTLSADPEWIYINVRRLFIMLEQSILRGTQWVVFEPNDPSLWKSIERNISAFLRIQWQEGKLVGATQEQAFFVRCNAETNPPEVVDAGQVITVIGVAPSKPAEFVIFRIKQLAGQSSE